jgi:aspartate/methionine/tyrosine aminotransferase
MRYARMPIEVESPEELGYGNIKCNLSESSIADLSLGQLGLTTLPDLKLLYGEHRGSRRLRELIVGGAAGLGADDVLVCGGAAGALFIIATALLQPGDRIAVVRPNYATNLETPRAIGCDIRYLELRFENGFRLELEQVRAALRSGIRILSVTTPHNPTGMMLTTEEITELAGLTKQHGCLLVVDETYRDLAREALPPLAATLGPHVISVSSLSKAYGAPGLRVGWIVNSDPRLQEIFLAAKEQVSICGSVIDEWVAERILERRDSLLASTLAEMRRRLVALDSWVRSESLVAWVQPAGGVVAFPRVSQEPRGGMDAFYARLMSSYGTYVGRGRWFEMPDNFFRLGFGWPSAAELEDGLIAISRALRE